MNNETYIIIILRLNRDQKDITVMTPSQILLKNTNTEKIPYFVTPT